MSLEDKFEHFQYLMNYVEFFEIFIITMMFVEIGWDFFRLKKRIWWETLANITIGAGNLLLERTAYGVFMVVALVIVQSLTKPIILFDIPFNVWTWVLAVIAADITYYWMHRIEHQIPFFWASHSVHHSSPEFNLSTGQRLCWWEGLHEWVFFLPMLLIGFDIVQIVISITMVVSYQSWIHTEKIGKLGFLDKILNTPSVHRVHHGTNKQYIDKNFGGFLIIWDRIWGTYEPEEETVEYGILPQLNSSNPIVINFYEIYTLCKNSLLSLRRTVRS